MNAILVVAFAIPPAAKVLAVIASTYAVLQAVKKIPALTAFLTGWVAIALNVALTAGGLLVAIPASDLYTTNTLILLITACAGAAGIHGTVKSLSAPTVLATVPPSTQAKEVPATLVPDDPKAVLVSAPPTQPGGPAKE